MDVADILYGQITRQGLLCCVIGNFYKPCADLKVANYLSDVLLPTARLSVHVDMMGVFSPQTPHYLTNFVKLCLQNIHPNEQKVGTNRFVDVCVERHL